MKIYIYMMLIGMATPAIAAPSYTYLEVGYGTTGILDLEPPGLIQNVFGVWNRDGIEGRDYWWPHKYDHTEVSDLSVYAEWSADPGHDDDVEQISASFSLEVSDVLYIFGEYSEGEDRVQTRDYHQFRPLEPDHFLKWGTTIDASTQDYSFGMGVRGRFFNDSTSWHIEAGRWESEQVSEYYSYYDEGPGYDPFGIWSYDEYDVETLKRDGMFYGAGLRSNVLDSLELNAGYRFSSVQSGGSIDRFTAGAVYSPEWAYGIGLTANVSHGEDLTTYRAGIRYTFR